MLCCTFFVHARHQVSYHTRYSDTRFRRTTLLNHKKCTPSSAQFSSSNSSAAPRRAVPCRALPCYAVLCRAACCTCSFVHARYYSKYHIIPGISYLVAVLLLIGCWLHFSFLSCRPVSLVLSNRFFHFFRVHFFSPLLRQIVWCATKLAYISFFPRTHCGWHCMAESPSCICNVRLSLVVCNHRARLYEASARTLVVLDVVGWKYQFNVKNTHIPGTPSCTYRVHHC